MANMVTIPDRQNLETMSRTDIQKLCKVCSMNRIEMLLCMTDVAWQHNNIKANMRTDEMINALCEVAKYVRTFDVIQPFASFFL